MKFSEIIEGRFYRICVDHEIEGENLKGELIKVREKIQSFSMFIVFDWKLKSGQMSDQHLDVESLEPVDKNPK